MSRILKILSILLLLSLMLLGATKPAHAFDGRGGDKVVIEASETVNDDLYVGANEFALDETVNGDVLVGAQTVTVNGKVTGNLIAAAQTVVVNGTVTGDVLAAAYVVIIGAEAHVGGDVVGAGYSLELQQGGSVARDAVMAGRQILLAGDIGRNVLAGTGALEIDGSIGGNVKAAVGEAEEAQPGPPPTMFMRQSKVPVPELKPGLTIDPSARIAGDLEYTQNSDLTFPPGVISGKVTRRAQPEDTQRVEARETPGHKVAAWGFRFGRSLVTLILVGLLLLRVVPGFVRSLADKLRSKPWSSLGWGALTWVGFFFLLLLIVFATALGAVVFGVLTLGGLTGAIISVGILAFLALIVGFVLATSLLSKVAFGAALGKWMLMRAGSKLAEHRYWPMVIGVSAMLLVVALLSFPLIPGLLGGLVNFAVTLFGLGAIWLWGRDVLRKGAAPT